MAKKGEFLKTWSLRSNSVPRQVNFKRTKNGDDAKIEKFEVLSDFQTVWSLLFPRQAWNFSLWLTFFEFWPDNKILLYKWKDKNNGNNVRFGWIRGKKFFRKFFDKFCCNCKLNSFHLLWCTILLKHFSIQHIFTVSPFEFW